MDTNGDHRISRSEFAKGVRKWASAIFWTKTLTSNAPFRSKRIRWNRFKTFIDFAADVQREADDRLGSQRSSKNIVVTATKGVDMKQSFKAFDSNGDGKISRKEFEEAVTKLGQALTSAYTQRVGPAVCSFFW